MLRGPLAIAPKATLRVGFRATAPCLRKVLSQWRNLYDHVRFTQDSGSSVVTPFALLPALPPPLSPLSPLPLLPPSTPCVLPSCFPASEASSRSIRAPGKPHLRIARI